MTVSERMGKEAVKLAPGEHFDGLLGSIPAYLV
jgi:hypothetical protein